MNKLKLGVALMPAKEFLKANLELFQEEKIDVLEWSYDTITDVKGEPEWLV